MIRALLLLLAFTVQAQAQTARVLSGEHGDFTRLVIELPAGMEWTVGRTKTGYAFAARAGTQPDYDLSTVWQRIPRARLADLAVDPTSGALSMVLGCDCHVFPFEYRGGIVVLDIKEGPAPKGSAFEAALPLVTGSPPIPDTIPAYDWLDGRSTSSPTDFSLPLPLDTGTVSLEPLRDELLEQIAKGAADGVVDMEMPGKPPKQPAFDHAELPWSHIRIGENPGVTVTKPGALIAEDALPSACVDPKLVDLATWGDDLLPHELLVAARADLYGEFDLPDEDSVLRSSRQLLYLGFGVETRQHLAMLVDGSSGDTVSLYRSMAHLVDGETDPQSAFASMLECEGPPALWAALAQDRFPPGPAVNRDAILQAFLALPAHLRRHLGPALAEKFLARDDSEAVRIIRDAMERSPDVDQGTVALIDAKASLQQGDADAAQAHAETAVALDGDSAENLVALVETHFHKLQPMDPQIADALMAIRGETRGGQFGAQVDRALVLALALSDQIQAAFKADPAPSVLSDLWRVVEARTADDDFLRHAVLTAGAPRPDVAAEVAQALSDRLLALGFPDAALVWLGPVAASDPVELRETAAKAQLGRRDARAALALLDGLAGAEAEALRAKALLLLGDLSAAQSALSRAGDSETASRVGLWEGNWSGLAPESAGQWQATADLAQPLEGAQITGLLGRGNQTVEASLAARDAIDALLADVPPPDGN
ncbi:lipopolysaccharide assembly protein LapB [Tabrizicola sp.]|uniref:tetratricopeptide repeat protein n=1 Tax=Tabrizicola sp. TaxID=2005166 RepID=UPI002733A7B1|nr:hypothetical protein [Tabrizicola sp.]MDP3193989.1 hypothetical protein [Tabrizicola sp.]